MPNRTTTLAACALLAASSHSIAGVITPELDRFLYEAEAEEYVPIIVHLRDRVDLTTTLADRSAPGVVLDRGSRHEAAVLAMKAHTSRSQGEIRSLLSRRQSEGVVDSFTPFWIANALYVEALPEVINELAMRPVVSSISYDTPIELVEPVSEEPATKNVAAGAESGLKEINAHLLWAQGYTGEGVLVSHLDTGADGNHPAIGDRWRGHEPEVSPAESFFDPVTNWTFPRDSGDHGTHTMGTICGMTPGDTIGVAFDATWISAAVIDRVSMDRTMADAILAFQWTADPDGDPGTVDDVPVVSSNSWGFSPIYHGVPHCDDAFWDSMDGAEAAGVAIVFAAGNEGSGSKTLRTPADRITTTTNAFAVGALRPGSETVASFSSRGPSGCDNVTIKPEVSARGESVRSSIPGNGYAYFSGTSMACPHVAGGVALLYDINPDLDPARAKEILMETAVDLGSAGEDNTYGWGRIDLLAAGQAVASEMGGIYGVVSGEGSLLEGVRVEDLGSQQYAVSDSAGDYLLSVTPGATYDIRASFYGYRQEETSVTVPPETFVEVNFDLETSIDGTLSGTISDSQSGLPVEGVEVAVLDTPLAPVFSNSLGAYELSVAGGAAYDVSFSKLAWQPVVADDVSIVEGQNTTLDISLDPFPTIFVWEPDPTPISGNFIRSYFENRGQEVLVAGNLDEYGNLSQFAKVFVCLGMSPNAFQIDPAGPEDLALVAFLEAGGGRLLYIEGGDFWAFDPATQVRSYFNISGVSDGADDLFQVAGAPGTPTEGMSFTYRGENEFVDRISPVGGAKAIWYNPNGSWVVGVLNTAPSDHLTIGQSFEIGGLGGTAMLERMMALPPLE